MADQVNVQVSVPVRIEQGDARSGDLRDLIAPVRPRARGLRDARASGDFREDLPSVARLLFMTSGKGQRQGREKKGEGRAREGCPTYWTQTSGQPGISTHFVPATGGGPPKNR